MGNCVIDNSMVPHPRQCRLAMTVERERISVVIADSLQEPGARLLCRDIQLPFEVKDQDSVLPAVAAIENAVYENPALLADYDAAFVSVDSGMWTVVPQAAQTEDMDEAIAIASLPQEKTVRTTAVRCPIDGTGTVLVSLLPTEIVGFLQRTFNNPSICHPLQLLAAHFVRSARINGTPTVHAHFRAGRRMDIIVLDRSSLLLANTFSYHDPMDAVYYLLASTSTLGLEAAGVQLRLSGEPSSRQELMPLISPHMPSVMSAVFPAALLREGTQALNAPLELTTKVCE